ncbi:unnamed protein product [Closterium sp. Naga37s-1]|nr:unnamed protein product [Closterium sp. Naga37s-1]
MGAAATSSTANSPSTCRITTSSSHTSATRTNAYYSHATTRSYDTRSGGASPAAAISPPPSSSFPATSVFLPALLRLGADLSDDPDDREQVVAQGFARAHARPQGRRHRRTGSLDAMLLAETATAGKRTAITCMRGGGNTTAGSAGTTAASSTAGDAARSMEGGSKKVEEPSEDATSFPAMTVSDENCSSRRSSSSGSNSSCCDDSTGFKGFQSVPTASRPATGSPEPVGFGSAGFIDSSGFKGFKPAFLRLGDDLGDDPDDWEWLAGGQQLTWSNPGGPLKEGARGDDDIVSLAAPSVSLAAPSVSLAAPSVSLAAPSVSLAAPSISLAAPDVAALVPALPPRSPKPVAGPVEKRGSFQQQQQQPRLRRQQHRRTHSSWGSGSFFPGRFRRGRVEQEHVHMTRQEPVNGLEKRCGEGREGRGVGKEEGGH